MDDLHDKVDWGDICHISALSGLQPPVSIPAIRLRPSTTTEPESPLVEKARDFVSKGMTAHSLDMAVSLMLHAEVSTCGHRTQMLSLYPQSNWYFCPASGS